MNIVKVNRTSSLAVITLIELKLILAITSFFPELILPENINDLLNLFYLLSLAYIYLYIGSFLSQVMQAKGFNLLFILITVLMIVSSSVNFFTFQYAINITSAVGFLVFVLNIWIVIKLLALPYSANRRRLLWHIYILFIGTVFAASSIPIMLHFFPSGSAEYENNMFMIRGMTFFIKQLSYVPLLLMIRSYQKTQKA